MQNMIAKSPVLGGLWLYWKRIRGDRSMPRREDLDPMAIPRVLPYVALLERVEPQGHLIRLAGTAVEEASHCSLTGQLVDHIFRHDPHGLGRHVYWIACKERKAVLTAGLWRRANSLDRTVAHLVLPLSDDDRNVGMLLVGQTVESGLAAVLERVGPDRQQDFVILD